ncbi:MAG: hypothetical protein F4X97_11135 [Boseongicola sp. SB0662_bin_57]|nr:hypothetical protein [Boseongicola sp. SB0662_bin_57]
MASAVKRNFDLAAEFRRHRESDGPMTDRAYRTNRRHLDPNGTDHMKVYARYYKVNILVFTQYRLVVKVFTKRGETRETVTAFLRFDSL